MTRPAPRRWARRLAWTVLLATILVAAAVAFVQSRWFTLTLARALEAAIEAATGERAVVGSLQLQPLRATARVEGLVISHVSDDPSEDGQTVVAVQSVTVVAGLRDWRPVAARLEVDHPVVRLHLDEGGLREFRGARRSEGSPVSDFPWEELRVRGGALRLEGEGIRLDVEGIEVLPEAEPGRLRVELGLLGVEAGGLAQSASAVTLAGVHLAPDRVNLPNLDLAFQDFGLRGHLAVVAGGPLVGDLEVDASLPALVPLLGDRLRILGEAALDVELYGTTEAPLLVGALSVTDLALDRRARDETWRRFDLGDVAGGWRWGGRQLLLEGLTFARGGGSIVVDGAIDPASRGINLSASGESVRFATIMRELGVHPHAWVDFRADLETHVAGTLSPLQLAGTFNVVTDRFEVASGPAEERANERILTLPVLRAWGEIHVDPHKVRLFGHDVATWRSHGEVDATIGLQHDGPLDLEAALDVLALADLAPLGDIELGGVGPVQGRLWGPFDHLQADARATIQNFAVFGIPFADELASAVVSPELKTLHLPGFEARKGATRYGGSFEIDFAHDSALDLQILMGQARVEDVMGMFLDVGGVEGALEGSINLQGDPLALDGEAQLEVRDVSLFGEHFDQGSARAWMDAGRFTLEHLELSRQEGAEGLLARGTVGAGWAMDVEILGSGFTLERLDHLRGLAAPLRGRLELDARVGGVLFEPEPHGRIALRETRLGGNPVGDTTLYFDTRQGVARFTGEVGGPGLGVDGVVGLWEEQPYRLLADFYQYPLHQVYPTGADRGPVDARVTGRLELQGTFGDSPTPVQIDAVAQDVRLAWSGHELRSARPWRYSQRGRAFRLEGFNLAGGNSSVALSGGRDEQGRLELAGTGQVDLDLARLFVADLQQAEGVASLRLDMTGGRGEVLPELRAEIHDATFLGTWMPEPFEDVDAVVTASPTSYRVVSATGRLGGGQLEGSGRIDTEDWIPKRYDLAARLTQARVQYLDYLPPIEGDAELSFDGPVGELLLSGRIDVKDMLFSERIDWETWVTEFSGERLAGAAAEESSDLFNMDIAVTADKSVRMRNNVADLEASARLRVVGDTARPGLVGDVRAEPEGRVYLKEREFELTRGELHFIDPFTFDPELDLAMTTEVRARDQTYDIEYRVSGPYSDWRAETTSNPALAQADVNALLLFGMTREELERYGGLTGALTLEGADLLASRIGVVERVAPITGLLQPDRIDLVTGSTARGSRSISSELRVLVEKDWGPSSTVIVEQTVTDFSGTYVGFEQRLARKLYARGYWTNEQFGRNLYGGAVGTEFNFRWELD